MDSSLAGGLLQAIAGGLSGYQTQKQRNKDIRMKAFADFLERERQKKEDEEIAKYRSGTLAETGRHNLAMEQAQTQGNLNDIFMRISQPIKQTPPLSESQVRGQMLMELRNNPALADNPAFKWALGPTGKTEPPRPAFSKFAEPSFSQANPFQNLPSGWSLPGLMPQGNTSAPQMAPQGGGNVDEILRGMYGAEWDALSEADKEAARRGYLMMGGNQ